jgi:hypothetical protein
MTFAPGNGKHECFDAFVFPDGQKAYEPPAIIIAAISHSIIRLITKYVLVAKVVHIERNTK